MSKKEATKRLFKAAKSGTIRLTKAYDAVMLTSF
jgi:hypothetical protein